MQHFWDTCRRIVKDHGYCLSKYCCGRWDIWNSTARFCSPRCTGFSHVEPVSGCIVPYMRLSILFFDRFIKKGKNWHLRWIIIHSIAVSLLIAVLHGWKYWLAPSLITTEKSPLKISQNMCHVSKKQNMNRKILKVRFLGMFCRKINKNQIFKPKYGKKKNKKYGRLFGMCVVAHLPWPTSKTRGGDKICC